MENHDTFVMFDGTIAHVGDTVDVQTSRFGRATVTVLQRGDEFCRVEVVAGVLRGIRDEWHPGEQKDLRLSHCHFYPRAEA